MSAGELQDSALERSTVNAAVWGSQAADLRAELAAAEFTDDWCAQVAAAVAELGSVPAHELHEHLVARGVHQRQDFWRLVFADVAPGYLEALPYLLDMLKVAAQRRTVGARLVALADMLEHRDGPARVAELLGVAS